MELSWIRVPSVKLVLARVPARCYGLATNFGDCGDFEGLPFNLQVLYWIESAGGRL